MIKKLQDNAKNQASVLDDDVLQWINTQDPTTIRHINEVIHHFMAIEMA